METSYMNQPQAAVPVNGAVQQVSAMPVQANYVPAAPARTYPVQSASSSTTVSRAVSAGFFGFVVVSTGVMGANLNKVANGKMSVGQALGDSVVKGASGAVAAASASTATNTLTSGGVAGLAVTLATATGVSYLINRLYSKGESL